jgi:hypothetical protein
MVGRTTLTSNDYPTAKEVPLSYYNSAYLDGQFDGVITKIGTPAILVGTKEQILPQHSAVLSPNPCNEALMVNIDGALLDDHPEYVSIYDVTGKMVLHTKNTSGTTRLRIDTRDLPSGTYLLSISFATGQWTGTFVKSTR